MVTFSMTLTHPNPVIKVTAFLKSNLPNLTDKVAVGQ